MRTTTSGELHTRTELRTHNNLPKPPHSATNQAHMRDLMRSIDTHGWKGAPLVADGDRGLTGSHRIAALGWIALNVTPPAAPVVQLADVCALHGIDWDELSSGAESFRDWKKAVLAAVELLPQETVQYLGLELY